MINPMHPKIKAFWENAGYKVFFYAKDGNNKLPYVYAVEMDEERILSSRIIARTTEEYGLITIDYFLDNQKYTESQMLKLIKLKSFL